MNILKGCLDLVEVDLNMKLADGVVTCLETHTRDILEQELPAI